MPLSDSRYSIEPHPKIPPELIDEYRLIDARWQSFDGRLTTIKGAAALTFGSLTVAYAANASSPSIQTLIALVTMAAMIFAWHQDWQNRCWQRAFFWRALSIEEFIRGDGPLDPPFPLQIWTSWHRVADTEKMTTYRRTQWRSSETAMPYFALCGLAAIGAVWSWAISIVASAS